MQNTFPEMRSESYNPGYISGLKWGITALFALLAIVLLVLLISDFSSNHISSLIIYGFLFLIFGALAGGLVYDIVRSKEHKVSCLIVSQKGVLFLNSNNKVLSEIKYQNLVKSENPYTKDLFSETATGKTDFRKNFFVHERGDNREVKKKQVNFDIIPLKNRYDLIGHFLKGVTLFRPDLSIDPEVYKDFYLDEKTFRFMPENLKKDIVLKVVILAVVILVLVFIIPLFK